MYYNIVHSLGTVTARAYIHSTRVRRCLPVVFAVDAAAMHKAGYTFYCSDNGIWLVDSVPSEYLTIASE